MLFGGRDFGQRLLPYLRHRQISGLVSSPVASNGKCGVTCASCIHSSEVGQERVVEAKIAFGLARIGLKLTNPLPGNCLARLESLPVDSRCISSRGPRIQRD